MRRLLARLLQPLEATVVLVFYCLLGLLPATASSAIAGWAMRRIGPRLGAHRTARRNLERAYPGRPPAEIAVVLDGMWENLGRNIGEFPHLRRMLEDPDVVEVAGPATIEALHRAGDPEIGRLT